MFEQVSNRLRAVHPLAWLILLTITMGGLYSHSVPDAFNRVYENRRYFDSDGEFITRQFIQEKTFTHNDHLLYHVLARWLYDHADVLPLVEQNPVSPHKLLSVAAGALGIALLTFFGQRILGRWLPALTAALLVGGTSSYWFFAATIDTYQPALCAGILALGLTMEVRRNPRPVLFASLGGALGLAILFRTDSVLLIPLAGLAWTRSANTMRHAVPLMAGFFITGILGYAALAHGCYGVEWADVPAWAAGHSQRPEATDGRWGSASNISAPSLLLVLTNQLFYAVLLPGLETTAKMLFRTDASVAQIISMVTPVLTLLALAVSKGIHLETRTATLPLLAAMLLCVLPRTIFYTWWNPAEPFLFSVLSIPWLWLAALAALNAAGRKVHVFVILFAVVTWNWNWVVLIRPL